MTNQEAETLCRSWFDRDFPAPSEGAENPFRFVAKSPDPDREYWVPVLVWWNRDRGAPKQFGTAISIFEGIDDLTLASRWANAVETFREGLAREKVA